MTGLDAIRRVGAAPKMIFIDIQAILQGIDHDLIDAVFTPLYWRVRVLVPPLRLNRNWVVLLYRKMIFKRSPDQTVVEFPRQTLAQWNEQINNPRMEDTLQDGQRHVGPELQSSITDLVQRIREFQERGARIIIYNPFDPRLRRVLFVKEVANEIKLQIPDVELIDAPDDKFPIYRIDGRHYTAASGLQFFNYLMDRAELPYSAKCELRMPSSQN